MKATKEEVTRVIKIEGAKVTVVFPAKASENVKSRIAEIFEAKEIGEEKPSISF